MPRLYHYFMRTLLLKLFVITALVFISALSMRYAIADYYYQSVKDRHQSLGRSNIVTAENIRSLIADIDSALSKRGTHTDALDLKADLLYQLWWISPDGQYLQQSTYLQEALKLHLRSKRYRGDWAYVAARIALIYSQQAFLDEKFSYWFAESHRLGLYETAIARTLAELGLQHWALLTNEQRKFTADYIRVSIEQKVNSPMSMALMLNKYQKHEDLCLELPSTARKDQVCSIVL